MKKTIIIIVTIKKNIRLYTFIRSLIMENEILDMDILRMPTPEETIVAKILDWVVSAKPDQNKVATIVFKKDTPAEIFRLYKKNFNLMPFPSHFEYVVEK